MSSAEGRVQQEEEGVVLDQVLYAITDLDLGRLGQLE